ncbi:MAG: hypothetical protein F4047_09225 [Caldilineaceae bacterium SB0670_bin_27]|uniref:Uncharacterized protein n=1 Tax=Caldilineaceae bacterium SB0664_bin_27 TaxID=2605260 RepID=A0A6B0YR00_9CHLR|nr:hypothetical protein [Caldilineaceae bacterium SB0664_bin_27]MYJ78310.1 hypothetical protein [Caldilineaceae bacterium SB0670_bin_27]
MESLFLQGVVFSALVIGGLAIIGWWLFMSPLDRSLSTDAARNHVVVASPQLSFRLAILIGISSLLICAGSYWDLSEHVITGTVPGGEDFLWPPHIMIYASFLLAFLVALSGTVALAIPNLKSGVRDPRLWARHNPYVAAAVLLAGYGLLSIPSDAIWHELYGLDLTPWSPPHIFLAAAAASLPVAAVGLMGRAQIRGRLAKWTDFLKLIYLALGINLLLIIAVIEWEVVVNHIELVANRPVWVFPLITGAISFAALVLARRVAPGPWTATVMALIYLGIRVCAMTLVLQITGVRPKLTLIFLLGALFLDMVCQRMDRRGIHGGWRRALIAGGAFTVGFIPIARGTINVHLRHVMEVLTYFDFTDTVMAALALFLLTVALYPVLARLGDWLEDAKKMV